MNPPDRTDATPASPAEPGEPSKGIGSASPLAPLPDERDFPRWFAPAALALALAWAALLQTRGSELAGVSVAIVEAGYLAVVLAYYRRKPLDWFGWTLAGSALAAALWYSVFRSEDMGLYLRLVLCGLNLVLPAYASGAVRGTWDTLRGTIVKWRIAKAFFATIRPSLALCGGSLVRAGRSGAVARYGASLLVLAGLLLVVVPLLVTSDAAFAHIVRQIVPQWLYELDFPRVVRIVLWTILFALFVSPFVLAPSRVEPGVRSRAFGALPLSWPLILGGVVAVYALYVGVQVRYFFLAADANVYQALGLTYAEYVHKGFYELLAVSFVNIAIAKGAFELSRKEGQDAPSTAVRLLIAAVAACAIVIACSGLARAGHYVAAYGLSVERVLVAYASALAIAVFALGLVKLAWPRLREVPVAVALSLVSFIALGWSDVEETVASYNIAHRDTVPLDARYILSDLSEDALDEKLLLVRADPDASVYETSDWECIKKREGAWEDGQPESAWPTCGSVPVSARDALYKWLLEARARAG